MKKFLVKRKVVFSDNKTWNIGDKIELDEKSDFVNLMLQADAIMEIGDVKEIQPEKVNVTNEGENKDGRHKRI